MFEARLKDLIQSVSLARVLNPSASPLEWLPSSTRPAARHAQRVIFAELPVFERVAVSTGVPCETLVLLTYICLAHGLTAESKAQCGECWVSRAEQQSRLGITGLSSAELRMGGVDLNRLSSELCLQLAAERLAALAAPSFGLAEWEAALVEYCRNPETAGFALRAA